MTDRILSLVRFTPDCTARQITAALVGTLKPSRAQVKNVTSALAELEAGGKVNVIADERNRNRYFPTRR